MVVCFLFYHTCTNALCVYVCAPCFVYDPLANQFTYISSVCFEIKDSFLPLDMNSKSITKQ